MDAMRVLENTPARRLLRWRTPRTSANAVKASRAHAPARYSARASSSTRVRPKRWQALETCNCVCRIRLHSLCRRRQRLRAGLLRIGDAVDQLPGALKVTLITAMPGAGGNAIGRPPCEGQRCFAAADGVTLTHFGGAAPNQILQGEGFLKLSCRSIIAR